MDVLIQNLAYITLPSVIMWIIGGVLIYLAIAKEMEPTLLLPMGFGAILVNLPIPEAGTGVQAVIPWLLGKYSIVPVVIIIALALVIICAKFVFTKVITKENKYYSSMNKFFTSNRMGTLLTTSALSFLLCALLSLVLHVRGENVLTFASVNRIGLWLILAMVLQPKKVFIMTLTLVTKPLARKI
jgi:Na+-transporting methylmalonyl-CoA/oxaloacetate decarboxylase beta subunit